MTPCSASKPEKRSEPTLDVRQLVLVQAAKHRHDPTDRLGFAGPRRLRPEHAVDGRATRSGDREQHERGRRDGAPLDARDGLHGEIRRLSELRLREPGCRAGTADGLADRYVGSCTRHIRRVALRRGVAQDAHACLTYRRICRAIHATEVPSALAGRRWRTR